MIWHKAVGNGPVKVVVVHGWIWDHRVFTPILDALDTNKHTYAFVDIRGYGNSRDVAGSYSIGEVASDVIALADQLGWRDFHVVGHSMGGKAAQKAAIDAAGRVRSIVAVTPASGFAGPMGAIVLGLIVGVVCLFFCTTVKNALGYDDAFDVFGVHCVGGIVGAIGTGILVNPALGGTGIFDYQVGAVADYAFSTQVIAQIKAVLLTLVWSGVGSLILYKVVDILVGLRPSVEKEREGLDINDHGERAYTM